LVQRFTDVGGLAVLVAGLILVGLVALGVELVQGVIRWRRHRAVARELATAHLSVAPSSLAVSDRRRPPLVRAEVPALRPGEPGDPGAAKVLAFRIALEKRGCYVHELGIQKRLN
jgi:hypothetical protein